MSVAPSIGNIVTLVDKPVTFIAQATPINKKIQGLLGFIFIGVALTVILKTKFSAKSGIIPFHGLPDKLPDSPFRTDSFSIPSWSLL